MIKVMTANNIKINDKIKSKIDDHIALLDKTLDKIDAKKLPSIREQLKNL